MGLVGVGVGGGGTGVGVSVGAGGGVGVAVSAGGVVAVAVGEGCSPGAVVGVAVVSWAAFTLAGGGLAVWVGVGVDLRPSGLADLVQPRVPLASRASTNNSRGTVREFRAMM